MSRRETARPPAGRELELIISSAQGIAPEKKAFWHPLSKFRYLCHHSSQVTRLGLENANNSAVKEIVAIYLS